MLIGKTDNEARLTAARTIKVWVRELLSVPDDVSVTVVELECREPGCPPKETVIAVLEDAKVPVRWKIHKATVDLSRDEIVTLLARPNGTEETG